MDMKQETIDLKIKIENKGTENTRCDPTSLLPEEPMTYEIKKKKKKKKKKQEDPFKDIHEKVMVTERIMMADDEAETQFEPEVTIKAENIEVDLDFNDFVDNTDLLEGTLEEIQEPEVKIEPQNHDAVILTFENIVKDKTVVDYEQSAVKSEVKSEASYLCKLCHLLFKSPKTLETHQKRKHKVFRRNFKHICDYCGMSYEYKNSLIAHIRRKHGPDAPPNDTENRSCDICAMVFKGMARLRMHMRRKHNYYKDSFQHVCPDCGLTYEKYCSLIVHMRRKHSKVKKPPVNQWYSCTFCPKMYTNRETYARHIQRKHRFNEDGSIENKDEYWESCKNEQGEIACKECPLVFATINFLKLHMRRKHNALREDFGLKCRICNLSYERLESLKRHIRRKHGMKTHCNICDTKFEDREAYLNHSHVKVAKECSLCGLLFASQGGLGKHLRCTHKIESPKVIFCSICNEGFHDKRLLKPHLMKVHLKVSYTCVYCRKVFKTRESYRRHIQKFHPVKTSLNYELQKCEQCSATFTDEFELCKHINLVHLDPESEFEKQALVTVKKEEEPNPEPFRCTKCIDTYSSWEQLRLHFEQTHYSVPHTQCQVCGQMVPEKELQRHMKVNHTVMKEVKCRYCEFKTDVRASMTQHMLRHKNASTLNCDYPNCRYKTYYEGAMSKHRQKHQEQGVKLQCSKCTFQTMNKYIMKYHEEAHLTGKKKYACNQCDYSTILPANLVQHKYKHSTEKRFKCEVCPFASKYNTSLRFHVKTKHCDLPTVS